MRPQNMEGILAAKILTILSASIIFILGGLLFQCISHRYQHFFGLVCGQHCAITGFNNALLTQTAITLTTGTGWFRILGRMTLALYRMRVLGKE